MRFTQSLDVLDSAREGALLLLLRVPVSLAVASVGTVPCPSVSKIDQEKHQTKSLE